MVVVPIPCQGLKSMSSIYPKYYKQISYSLLCVWMLLGLCGCLPRFIAHYDPTTDQMLTNLQRQVNGLLIQVNTTIGTRKARYRYYIKRYQNIDVLLAMLKTRVRAIPKNTITIQQIQLLANSISQLQALHKKGFKKLKQVLLLQTLFNTQIGAILKLELAKKYG